MREIKYEPLTVKMVGVSPLFMHNDRLADPMDPVTAAIKKVTQKKKKTDDDRALLAMFEWAGSLYSTEPVEVDDRANIISGGKVCIPADNLEGMISEGAKKIREKKTFQSGLMVESDAILEYPGPKSIAELQSKPGYRDTRAVKVQSARVMRTRPFFRSWSCTATFMYLPDIIDRDELMHLMETCGRLVGVGDYRPRYGRFLVEQA